MCYVELLSQHIYYGYPSDSIDLKRNDKIIVNIPTFNVDFKTFLHKEDFYNFVHLLKNNQTKLFRVEINYFFTLDSSFAKYSSDKLCDNFKKIVSQISNQTNFNMKSNGCSNPLYTRKDENSIKYNTRLEIIVE